MRNLLLILVLLSTAQCSKGQLYRPEEEAVPDVVFSVDFTKDNIGPYTDDEVRHDFGNIRWVSTKGRGEIKEANDFGKVLRVSYPKGSVGPQEGGIQFVRILPRSDEFYLDYYLKVEDGFDFGLGGKLPGLTSGGDKYTGGVQPDHGEGWSARYMWTKGGGMIVYLYYVDMKSEYGDHFDLKGVKLKPGKWHRLTQHIVLNTGSKKNGKIEVWFDEKKVVDEKGLRLRLNGQGMIDSFYFSTFHGGATPEWAPKNDSFICFDKITVSRKAPDFLK